jgi:hypothetical protein
MRGQFVGYLSLAASVVRRALEQDWKFLVAYRPIDIRHERHAVSHLHANTLLNRDSIKSLRVCAAPCENYQDNE